MSTGYSALRGGAAWIDLSSRGRIRAAGEDRARLLHAMTTNHVQQLQPGQGCYTFFLSAQGRILADANLLCLPEEILIETEPETRAKLFEHLDKFIIADDVALSDETEAGVAIGVEGPMAEDCLSRAGFSTPAEPYSHSTHEGVMVARLSSTGMLGWRLFAGAGQRGELIAAVERCGAVAASLAEAELVRMERGVPRYGADITEKNLVQETRLHHAVSFTKGCYIGQEIVERVRSRGQVHKGLAAIRVETREAVAPGTEIASEGQVVGRVTRTAWSPGLGVTVGFAYLRVDSLGTGKAMSIGAAPVTVVPDGL
ncbi:MAG: folate-binding protein YgfZ [Acidobacteria bacterium]|nr:folate-binding protein YgfZ [Acidobacteriota bacterium]